MQKTAELAWARLSVYPMGVRVDTTWRVRWIDLRGGCAATARYRYRSSVL